MARRNSSEPRHAESRREPLPLSHAIPTTSAQAGLGFKRASRSRIHAAIGTSAASATPSAPVT